MTIRLMSIDDYDQVFSLWSKTEGMGLRSLDDSKEGISLFLKRNPNTNFVCVDNDMVIGAILSGHDGRRAYIYHAVVDKNYRRLGIGSSLVEKVLVSLEKEGIKKVALVVYSNNNEGNTFWEKMNFTTRVDLTYRNKVIDNTNI